RRNGHRQRQGHDRRSGSDRRNAGLLITVRARLRIALSLCGFALAPIAEAQSHAPDFNGVYGRDMHNMIKPYSAAPRGYNVTDGYNNEYLKPWVVELINRDALMERSGEAVVTAHSVCYPESVPYVFGGTTIQFVQTEDEITM